MLAFYESAEAFFALVGFSVFGPVPVIVAAHAAYGPPSFVFWAFVDFHCMGPGSLLGDQLLPLDLIVSLIFGLRVALEGTESADCESGLIARPCFVAVLACKTVDRVHVSKFEVAIALGAYECSLL